MELIDPAASCFLVQAVNILGNYSQELPLLLPLCQLLVRDIGLEAQGQYLLPVKPKKVGWIGTVKAVTDDGLRRVLKFLMVQAIHTAKVGNPGLRADASPSKEHDAVTLLHPLAQSFQCVHLAFLPS